MASDDTKPGVMTSEFRYITILGSVIALWQQLEGQIPAPWGTIVMAILGAAYTISRAIAKKKVQNSS